MAAPIDSDVALCNRFLTRIGANQIQSLTEDTKQGRVINANYEWLRDDVNATHAWNFAIKRATLAEDAGATPNHGPVRAFTLPEDLLGFITEEGEIVGLDEPYRIEGDFLVTDAGTVKIDYVARIEDLNKWSSMAKEALIARLQAELTFSITDNASATDTFRQIYQQKIDMAGAYNGAESTPREFIVDTWVESRVGGYGYSDGTGSKVSHF
jgi:biotin carboxylase